MRETGSMRNELKPVFMSPFNSGVMEDMKGLVLHKGKYKVFMQLAVLELKLPELSLKFHRVFFIRILN